MASRERLDQGAERQRGRLVRRPVRLSVVVGSVVLAVVGVVLLFTVGRSGTSSDAVAATLRVPGNPGWITAGADALWVTLMSPPQEVDDRLVRVGLADGEVQRTVAPGGLLSFTTRAGDSLWAVWLKAWPDGPAELLELDWETGEVKGRVPVGNNARDLVYADGYIWATTGTDGTVLRIDPETREVVGEPIQIGSFALGIAAGEGAVWVSDAEAGVLVRIDPSSLETTRIAVGGFLAGVAVGGGNVWASDPDQGLYRIDPATLRVVDGPDPYCARVLLAGERRADGLDRERKRGYRPGARRTYRNEARRTGEDRHRLAEHLRHRRHADLGVGEQLSRPHRLAHRSGGCGGALGKFGHAPGGAHDLRAGAPGRVGGR